jgi:hypothetical protein
MRGSTIGRAESEGFEGGFGCCFSGYLAVSVLGWEERGEEGREGVETVDMRNSDHI